jgi:phage tail protein X
MQQVDAQLHANAGATAHIPPQRLLSYLYANPQWQALTRGELGEQLGVERLVLVELIEYRLHEPGNRYTYNGVASCVVQVFEVDSGLPDDPMYEQPIAVAFPDVSGILAEEMSRTVVTSELSRRLGERIAWLFFAHEERNDLPY